jgi:hypothetical protein
MCIGRPFQSFPADVKLEPSGSRRSFARNSSSDGIPTARTWPGLAAPSSGKSPRRESRFRRDPEYVRAVAERNRLAGSEPRPRLHAGHLLLTLPRSRSSLGSTLRRYSIGSVTAPARAPRRQGRFRHQLRHFLAEAGRLRIPRLDVLLESLSRPMLRHCARSPTGSVAVSGSCRGRSAIVRRRPEPLTAHQSP